VTSALDVSVQAVVIELLRNLRASRKLSILFVTHDLALARAICDRIAVVHDGSVVESGSAESIISTPRAEYTRHLVSNIPVIPEVSHPPL
jgi:peptide/nickel transport system ATP-binding protein